MRCQDGFNTQPPEGGWGYQRFGLAVADGFQHTAARRRLVQAWKHFANCSQSFNTQPPEGGWFILVCTRTRQSVSTHSRPKAAGCPFFFLLHGGFVSTHSRPKAAGTTLCRVPLPCSVSTHSRPKAAGRNVLSSPVKAFAFQHTAARRRLGSARAISFSMSLRFNTQPPEGGWQKPSKSWPTKSSFNTQPPEGGWRRSNKVLYRVRCFNTQPPEGGWWH